MASICLPLYLLLLIPSTFAETTEARAKRCALVVALVLLALVIPFITDAIVWGSFPFNIDNNGVARLRLIPFIPWPEGKFGDY